MHVIAVNAGKARPVNTATGMTGIYKEPLSGPVPIGFSGIAGDTIVNKSVHGGPDQALYLYGQPDYDYWVEELGIPIAPGTFGENLTLAGMHSAQLCVGDRLTIGDAVLELTAPREPCNTFAQRMNNPQIVKKFFRAGLPGAYARIIAQGTIEAGMPVALTPYEGIRVTMREILFAVPAMTPEAARHFLKTPIAARMRARLEAIA